VPEHLAGRSTEAGTRDHTPRRDLSNALNVGVLLSEGIYYFDTIELFMQRMVASLSLVKERENLKVKRQLPHQPRKLELPLSLQPSNISKITMILNRLPLLLLNSITLPMPF